MIAADETPGPRDCVVLLTHLWSPRIAAHFDRLKREAGRVQPVFLAYNPPDGAAPGDVPADVVVRMSNCAAIVPYRYRDHFGRGPVSVSGYCDMIWLAAMLDPVLAGYDRIWLVEYDVDFSGDWASFFGTAAAYDADLLTAHVRRRSAQPNWILWQTLRQPANAPADPLAAFLPISRYSRAALAALRKGLASPGWRGHLEIVWPSIIGTAGLSIADIGGDGPFTPADRIDRHYRGNCDSPDSFDFTHRFSPPRGQRYFVDAPELFLYPNQIYHPIKAEGVASIAVQPRDFLSRLGRLLRRVLDRVERRLAG